MVRWVSKTQEETEMARRGENIHKRKEGRYIKARTSEGKIQWGLRLWRSLCRGQAGADSKESRGRLLQPEKNRPDL